MTIQERLARPEGEEQFYINDIKLLINPSDIVSLDDDYVVEETFLRSHGVFAHKSRHANSKIKVTLPFEVPPISTVTSKDEPNHQYIRLIAQVSHYPFCFIKSNRVRTYVSPSSLSETEYMIFAVDEVRVTQDVTLGNMLILELVLIFFNHIPLVKDFQFTDKIVFNKFKKELADKDLILGTTLASSENAYKEGSLKDDRRYVNKIVPDLSQSTSFNEYTKHILNKILTNIELINKRTKATSITNFGVGLGVPYISEVNADILVGRELTQVLGSDFKMVTVTKITPNNNAFTDLVTGGDNAQQFDGASKGNVPSRETPKPTIREQQEELRNNNPNLPQVSSGNPLITGTTSNFIIGKDANGNTITTPRPNAYVELENKRREEEAKRKAEDQRKTYVDNWGNSSEDEIQKIIAANAKELFINYSELPLQKEVGVSVQSITVTRKNRLALHPIGGFKHPVIQYMGNYATDVTMKLAFDTQNKYGSELGPSLLMKQANSQLEYNRVYWPEATAHNYLKIYSLATALMGTEMFLPAQSQIIASASNNGLEIGVFNFIETNIEEFLKETSVRGSGIKNTANYNKYMNDILLDLTNYFIKNFTGIATLKNDPVFNIYASMVDVIAEEYYETRIYELFHGENLKINPNSSSLKIRDLPDDKELKRYLDFLSRSILKIRQLALNNKEGDQDKELTQITDKIASAYGKNNPTIKAYIQKILTEGFSGSIGLNSYLDQLMLHLNEDAKYSSITVKYLENYLTLFSFNVKRFNSVAIPDLYLENLTLNITEKIENDVASINEIALQSMTPFFFIKETPHLTDTNIEDQILQLQNLDTLQENIVAMSKANIEGDKLEWGGDNPNIDAAIPLRYGNVIDERIYETAKLTEEERKRKGAQATGTTEAVKAEQTVSINTQDLTVQGMRQSQINWMVVVYKAFIELNLDSTLAAALTAEVGREGEYLEINMFGTHKDDGNSKTNLGIISFQGNRRENLISFMKARGFELVDNQFPKTEECIKAQAAFIVSELEGTYKDIYGVILQEIEKGATADDLSDKVYAPYASASTYGPLARLESGNKGNIKYGKPLLVSYIGWVWGDDVRYKGVWQRANNKRRGYLKNLENILLTHATANPKVNPKANSEVVTLKEHAIPDNTLRAFFVNVLYDGDTATEAVVLPANKPTIPLRFSDINAPEIKKSDTDPTPEHYALESRDNTKAWLAQYNNIIYIPAALLGKETEAGSFANRGLAFKIYVRKGPNIYYEVAEKSLKEGWAKALTGNLAKEKKYKEWENEAKTALRGLWKPSTTVAADANNPNPIVDLAIPKNLFDRTVNHGTKRGDKLADDIVPIKVRPGDNWAITSGFGLRTRVSTSGGVSSSNHPGIDLANFGANGTEGAELIALGTGVVINKGNHGAKKGYGHFLTIRYTTKISTLYGHMKQASNLEIGDSVQKGQVVGLVGNTGNSSGAHLHFEMLYDGVHFNFHALKTGQLSAHFANPSATLNWDKLNIDVASSLPTYLTQPIKTEVKKTPKEYSLFNEKIIYEFFKQNMKKTINRGLLTSVPSIKVYVTIGNEDQDLFFTNGVKIQYYEINGIRAVKLKTNDDRNPIDVMSLVIADAAFVNTDHMAGLRKLEMVDIEKIGTDLETQFKNDRIKLRPGMKLHVRMGYSNDPNDLDIVFNGSVISTRNLSATSIEVICESFGKELLGEIIGHNKPKSLGGGWNASTGTLFADVLLSNSIYHFGKTWSLARSILHSQNAGDSSDPEAKTLLQSYREDPKERVGETNIFNMNYYFGVKFLSAKALRHRIYTNIYTAEIEHHDDEFDSPLASMVANLFQIGKPTRYSFYAFHDTPWSVMKQAEYRHPGTIAKPLWYEDRCTMFYGIKEQCYIAREGNTTLQQMAVAETISGKVGNINYGDGGISAPGAIAMVGATGAALVATALAPATMVVLGGGFLASLLLKTLYGEDKIKAANTNFLDQYYLRRVERMAPAVEFHIITCKSNLISNGIKLNSDYKTKLNVSYFIDDRDVSDGYDRNFDSFAMQSDDNLNAFDIREGEVNLAGCDGKYMSYRYGTTGLMKEAETMYGGSIFILGQPNMKAGDYAYLDDSTLRLQGIIKIRECYHHFDEKRGFITEIVPGQYVEPAQFMRSPLFLKFGLAGQNIANLLKEQSHFTSRDFSDYSDTIAIMHQVITLGELQGLDYFNSLIIENPYTTITTSTTAAFFYLTLRRVLGKLSTRPLGFISNMFKFGATSTRFGWYLGTNAGRIAVGTLTASYRGLGGLRAAAKANPGFVSKTSAIYATMQAKGSALIQTAKELPAKIGVATAAARTGTVTTRLGEGARIILRFGKVNPLGLLLDVFFTLALAYVFAKVEEDKFARQPLVFYPLIRHGKTYTAGMSGVIRNGKFASLKMELGKTWKAVKRATTIVNANRENSNLAPVFNFINNPSAYRKITPSFALSKEELIKDPIYIELSGQRPSR